MNINEWIKQNCGSLKFKTVAISGSTGELGKALCRHLAFLGASLILLDRNTEKSNAHKNYLEVHFPNIKVSTLPLDLENFSSVKKTTELLKNNSPDILILNAGAYAIPRRKTDLGYDNVFQINFLSPYYMVRELSHTVKKVVAVGSIAHRYSNTDENDIDFSTRRRSSLVYGNSKRYLMFSLFELFKSRKESSLSVVHPGISFTGITAHYPKLIFAVIKHPMKVIFMKPERAVLSILSGVYEDTPHNRWIGPALFDIWGYPKSKRLKISEKEQKSIFENAERLYKKIKTV